MASACLLGVDPFALLSSLTGISTENRFYVLWLGALALAGLEGQV